MRTGVYESAVLINAALDDQQIESILSKIKDFITNNGGKIREFENWGRKRLAYTVEKVKSDIMPFIDLMRQVILLQSLKGPIL